MGEITGVLVSRYLAILRISILVIDLSKSKVISHLNAHKKESIIAKNFSFIQILPQSSDHTTTQIHRIALNIMIWEPCSFLNWYYSGLLPTCPLTSLCFWKIWSHVFMSITSLPSTLILLLCSTTLVLALPILLITLHDVFFPLTVVLMSLIKLSPSWLCHTPFCN